jgi:hypothetical protein
MKRILVLIFGASLSGCVGITFYGNQDAVVSQTDFSRVASFEDRERPPNRAPDKQYPDGSVMYVLNRETEWCGTVIWAIIPIPLMLPLCHSHTEMTYKDGKPIQMRSQGSGLTHGAACSPFGPVLSGKSKDICGVF